MMMSQSFGVGSKVCFFWSKENCV